jgi:hypothetical protein
MVRMVFYGMGVRCDGEGEGYTVHGVFIFDS